MRNPFKRTIKPDTYKYERVRLLDHLNQTDPASEEYKEVMHRLNDLDKMINRTSEFAKTIVPALGTLGGVVGIYGLQQFGGVIVPKVLESIGARQEARKAAKELD